MDNTDTLPLSCSAAEAADVLSRWHVILGSLSSRRVLADSQDVIIDLAVAELAWTPAHQPSQRALARRRRSR